MILGLARWAAVGAVLVATIGCSADSDGDRSSTAVESTSRSTSTTDVLGLVRTWWRPRPASTWLLQLNGDVPADPGTDIVDVDGVDTSRAQVRAWQARGIRVICYINAGAWEDWRSDKSAFSTAARGKPLDGWPGERWLDTRSPAVLQAVKARIDLCAAKGFDAVDPDNVDGWANDTGFHLTRSSSARYLRSLAAFSHRRGLGFGLKNDVDQVAGLDYSIDFAVNEECLAYRECSAYAPLVRRGQAVLHVEYAGTTRSVCQRSPRGFSTIKARLELDGPVVNC